MNKMTFDKVKCTVCEKMICTNGVAFTTHMRSHVKKGEVMECKRCGKLAYVNCNNEFLEQEPLALLGNDPIMTQPKGVWEIKDLSKDLVKIDPSSYFITSGDAVKKADKLVKDLYSLTVRAVSFKKKLEKARGSKKYLEVGWDNNRLVCKAKDPRNLEKVDKL